MSDELKNKLFFDKTTIIGVGFIGASFALALREKGLCKTISGCGRKDENLKRAKERGIINDYSLDLKKACEDSDLIFLSTPVGSFKIVVEEIKGVLKKGAVVTDAGSVKGRLVYDLEAAMPEGVCYIGAHPIAGSDKSGIDDARPDENAMKKIVSIWESFGARVDTADPFKHDEIYAVVSHFPHIAAYALVNTVADIDSKYIEYAGKGFKDTTRIALSSPEMWRDITMFNKENLIKLMDAFKINLDKIKKYLMENNESGIEEEFLKAQKLRESLK